MSTTRREQSSRRVKINVDEIDVIEVNWILFEVIETIGIEVNVMFLEWAN